MIKLWSTEVNYRRGREVVIVDIKPNGEESIAEPFIFKPLAPDVLVDKPTIGSHMGMEFLQAALDHAWEIGLRPRGFNDVPLQVEAIKKHLADMRIMAFLGKLPALVPPTIEDFEMPQGYDDRGRQR